MTDYPTLEKPRHRYLNLASTFRDVLRMLGRRDVKAEWTEFVSNGGQAEYDPGKLKDLRDLLAEMLAEVERASNPPR